MKWLRWWHLVPLFVIMIGCLGYFGKTKLIDPAEAAYKAAVTDFESTRNAATAKQGPYKEALDIRPKYCLEFINDAKAFQIMQDTMPEIYCEAVRYASNKEEGLRKWYYNMGKGLTLNELRRWVKKFPAQNRPQFMFTGTLGYETTLPSATIVKIPFKEQTVRVRGYNELARKIAVMTGYGYCPYVIKFVGTDIGGGGAAAPAAGAPGAPGAPGAIPGPGATPPGGAPASAPPAATPAPRAGVLIDTTKIASRLRNVYSEPYRGYYIASSFINSNIHLAQAAPPASPGGPPGGAATTTPAAPGATAPGGAPGAAAGGAPAGGAPAAAAAPAAGSRAGPLTITVIKMINGRNVYDPVRPILEFKYSAEAYFMTKGWDPYGDGSKVGVKTKIEEAKRVVADPGKPKDIRKEWKQPLDLPEMTFFGKINEWFKPTVPPKSSFWVQFPEPRMW
jgi:hypothetical protein